MIVINTEEEIEKIAESARIVGTVLRDIQEFIRPGVTTETIDKKIEEMIKSSGGRPAFKGYRGFPASSCISIDEVVVHGIPGKNEMEDGQIVGIDVGVEKSGYFGDACRSYKVGKVSDVKQKLLRVAEEALYKGIERCVDGNRLYDISHAIQSHVESNGFNVVKDMVGHGIGRKLHEEPSIPNYGKAGTGPILKSGMIFAIEPMVNEGTYEIKILDDRWTVVTLDSKPSAHFEHTVLITKNKPRILSEV